MNEYCDAVLYYIKNHNILNKSNYKQDFLDNILVFCTTTRIFAIKILNRKKSKLVSTHIFN